MRRRDLLAVAAGALAWSAEAQERRAVKVAFVSWHGPTLAAHIDHFRRGLRELGWVEGSNLQLVSQFTGGDPVATRAALQSAIADGADVIVTWTTAASKMASEISKTVPVVIIATDPVAANLVTSLARPGGNLTGVSMSGPELTGKRLELIQEIMPAVRALGFVGSARSAGSAAYVRELQAAAEQLHLRVISRLVDAPTSITSSLMNGMKAEGADVIIVQPILTAEREPIVRLAGEAGLPVISDYPVFAHAGALFTYGVDEAAQVHRTAYYVDRILKGAKAAEFPVEQPTVFQLVVNTKTATAFGLTIPDRVLARADEVVE